MRKLLFSGLGVVVFLGMQCAIVAIRTDIRKLVAGLKRVEMEEEDLAEVTKRLEMSGKAKKYAAVLSVTKCPRTGGWTIHGLWPQKTCPGHTIYDRIKEAIAVEPMFHDYETQSWMNVPELRQSFLNMKQFVAAVGQAELNIPWQSCHSGMDSKDFWAYEYARHGECLDPDSGQYYFNDPQTYHDAVLEAWTKFNTLDAACAGAQDENECRCTHPWWSKAGVDEHANKTFTKCKLMQVNYEPVSAPATPPSEETAAEDSADSVLEHPLYATGEISLAEVAHSLEQLSGKPKKYAAVLSVTKCPRTGGWSIHGLWPQKSCQGDTIYDRIKASIGVEPLFKDFKTQSWMNMPELPQAFKNMKHFVELVGRADLNIPWQSCASGLNSEDFWAYEYARHGECLDPTSGQYYFNDPQAYHDAVLEAWTKFNTLTAAMSCPGAKDENECRCTHPWWSKCGVDEHACKDFTKCKLFEVHYEPVPAPAPEGDKAAPVPAPAPEGGEAAPVPAPADGEAEPKVAA